MAKFRVLLKKKLAHAAPLVTPTHLVMAGECGGTMTLIRAENVPVGSCLASISGHKKIIASTKTSSRGVYSVITAHHDGIIVVNGFKASSFALNHEVSNIYYHIYRALYLVAPGMENYMAILTPVIELFIPLAS